VRPRDLRYRLYGRGLSISSVPAIDELDFSAELELFRLACHEIIVVVETSMRAPAPPSHDRNKRSEPADAAAAHDQIVMPPVSIGFAPDFGKLPSRSGVAFSKLPG